MPENNISFLIINTSVIKILESKLSNIINFLVRRNYISIIIIITCKVLFWLQEILVNDLLHTFEEISEIFYCKINILTFFECT